MIHISKKVFEKMERIIKRLIRRCKRKDKIIQAQQKQIKEIKDFYED